MIILSLTVVNRKKEDKLNRNCRSFLQKINVACQKMFGLWESFFIKALHHTYAKNCRKTWLSLQSEQINDLLFSSEISLYLKAYIMYIQG